MKTTNTIDNNPYGIARRAFLRRVLPAGALCAALVCTSMAAPVNRLALGGKRGLDVYTVNAYIGADLAPALLIDPEKPEEALAVTTRIYADILRSNPELRMAAIANDIATRQPDIVGLVELYKLELAPAVAGEPRFEVVYDYLELITRALAQMGAEYRVAVVSRESEVILPLLNPLKLEEVLFGRLTDSEAILVRSDLPPSHLKVLHAQSGRFQTYLSVSNIDVRRGWCLIDAFVRGERFRVVCTHLEDEAAPPVQYAQAQELLAGPAATSLPVILLGDFNADPLGRNGTVTYPLFEQAGFKDSWLELNAGRAAGGLTWGHDALLSDPTDQLEWRLDLVLYRGNRFTPLEADVLDIGTGSSVPPLWASDHKALDVSFRIGVGRPFVRSVATNRLVQNR